MDWPLTDLANTCVDYAAGLDIFLDNTYRDPNIRDSIEELVSLSKVLWALHSGLDLDKYGRNVGYISRDLDLACRSLQHSLNDIKLMFGRTRYTGHAGHIPYRQLWNETNDRLTQEEGLSLIGRLDRYTKFMEGLLDILRGQNPIADMIILREKIERLLRKQTPIETSFERVIIEERPAPQPMPQPMRPRTPSFRRTPSTKKPKPPPAARPAMNHYQTYPAPNVQPHPFDNPATAWMPQSPVSPGTPNSWDHWVPPFAPEVPMPQSPVYSDSSQQTWSSNSSMERMHWAPKLLSGRHPRTPFQTIGPPTQCEDRDNPQIPARLQREGFIEVFRTMHPDAKAAVKLYWRKDDHRARIVIKAKEPHTGQIAHYSLPLTSLKMNRSDNCLQLYRRDQHTNTMARWANLHFTDYERMTLFQCTFRALKYQDTKKSPGDLTDYVHVSEKIEFAAEIKDDNFRHTLRIIRDTDSQCVRLDASARRGELKGLTIWTAFVTDFIGSKRWMKMVGNNIVQLGQLHPYVFCSNFTPSGQSDTGAFQLKFTNAEDAASFTYIFNKLL